MNLIERAKNIIVKPKEEWLVIERENTPIPQLVVSYLIPLALIPAIAAFIRYGLIGFGQFGGATIAWGLKQAIISFVSTVGGVYLTAYIIDLLAVNFGSVKNYRRAMQLVVYSYTPMLLAGVFQIIPLLSFLSIVGLYGLYLLYIGLAPLMKTPADKVTGYFVVSLVVMIAIYIVISAVLVTIIVGRGLFGGIM